MPDRKFERCPPKGRAIRVNSGWATIEGRGEYDQIWVESGTKGTFTKSGIKLDGSFDFTPYTPRESKKKAKKERLTRPLVKCDEDGKFELLSRVEGKDLTAAQRAAAKKIYKELGKSKSHWQMMHEAVESGKAFAFGPVQLEGTIEPPEQAPGKMFTDFTKPDAEAFAERLKRYKGKPVVLTGGGGSGYQFAFLKDVEMEDRGDSASVRAHLRAFPGETLGYGQLEWAPYMGSWKVTPIGGV